MPNDGWLKLHRKILDWEWYGDINTMRLWIHILLKANHDDKKWGGKVIPAGTFITSYSSLAYETKLTVDEVRTSIRKLETSKNITRKSTNKYQAVTVANWEFYQSASKEIPSKSPADSQAIPKLFPSHKQEVKKIRNKEDKNIIPLTPLEKAVDDFKEFRKGIKKPMTPRAIELLYANLEKLAGSDDQMKIAILEQSILKGWAGVFDLKGGGTKHGQSGTTSDAEQDITTWNGYKL
jgi:hypothetical protein